MTLGMVIAFMCDVHVNNCGIAHFSICLTLHFVIAVISADVRDGLPMVWCCP